MATTILTQDTIERFIIPYLSIGKRGSIPKQELWRIVQCLLYRLKTGCQWHALPLKEFFVGAYSWQSVYYHWRQWSADGSWQRMWQSLLKKYKHLLDLSNVNVDGSQSRAVKGGEAVAYQGRKKAVTSNMLSISDRHGMPIALSEVVSGEHHDVYQIEQMMRELFDDMQKAGLSLEGLFLNADAGFDTDDMRSVCAEVGIELNVAPNPRNGSVVERDKYYDELLYSRRSAIERSYAWIDKFRALIIRYEVRKDLWRNLNVLACIVLFIKRILAPKKP